jgi:endonuclease/exonuclease/phosphatase family metal-dependent hydrolase
MKIKILSYNIHKGFSIGNRDFILDKIKEALRKTDADILFLQEVMGDHLIKKIPNWKTAIQFEYIADTFWPHFAYGKNAIYPEGHHGNAILSKFPIIEWQNHNLSTNRFEHRGLLQTRIMIPELEKEILLCNTHLNLTQKGRDLQADMITKIMKEEKEDSWILVGDFNDWNKKISPRLERDLESVEVFKSLHGNYPNTYPSVLPLVSLDRVFVHKLTPLHATVLGAKNWKKLSDHLPIYVEINIAD